MKKLWAVIVIGVFGAAPLYSMRLEKDLKEYSTVQYGCECGKEYNEQNFLAHRDDMLWLAGLRAAQLKKGIIISCRVPGCERKFGNTRGSYVHFARSHKNNAKKK